MIAFDKLTKQYGSFSAVHDLTFAVEGGEVFGFLGPNGAGKTTTIRMLMGILVPSAGRATIDGLDCQVERVEVKRRVGYLPDAPIFYDFLRGREILEFVAEMHGQARGDARRNAARLMEELAIEDASEEYAVNYSMGMKKRLGLACALIHDPSVLILDEPTNGLDPRAAREVQVLLKANAARGKTIFLSTHLLDMAERLCTRLGIIHKGGLVAVGELEALRREVVPGGTLEEVFLKATQPDDADGTAAGDAGGTSVSGSTSVGAFGAVRRLVGLRLRRLLNQMQATFQTMRRRPASGQKRTGQAPKAKLGWFLAVFVGLWMTLTIAVFSYEALDTMQRALGTVEVVSEGAETGQARTSPSGVRRVPLPPAEGSTLPAGVLQAVALEVLILLLAGFFFSLGSGELAKPDWDIEWLVTLPVPLSTLLAVRIAERTIFNNGLLLLAPFLTVAAWIGGYGLVQAAPLALLATLPLLADDGDAAHHRRHRPAPERQSRQAAQPASHRRRGGRGLRLPRHVCRAVPRHVPLQLCHGLGVPGAWVGLLAAAGPRNRHRDRHGAGRDRRVVPAPRTGGRGVRRRRPRRAEPAAQARRRGLRCARERQTPGGQDGSRRRRARKAHAADAGPGARARSAVARPQLPDPVAGAAGRGRRCAVLVQHGAHARAWAAPRGSPPSHSSSRRTR